MDKFKKIVKIIGELINDIIPLTNTIWKIIKKIKDKYNKIA